MYSYLLGRSTHIFFMGSTFICVKDKLAVMLSVFMQMVRRPVRSLIESLGGFALFPTPLMDRETEPLFIAQKEYVEQEALWFSIFGSFGRDARLHGNRRTMLSGTVLRNPFSTLFSIATTITFWNQTRRRFCNRKTLPPGAHSNAHYGTLSSRLS